VLKVCSSNTGPATLTQRLASVSNIYASRPNCVALVLALRLGDRLYELVNRFGVILRVKF